jgi:hypothetical protein
MTAEPTGHAMWSPDPIRQWFAARTPFDIRLPVRDITP